jgi:DNA helicase-2/ATP-dependent DNA helicase PcrA
LAHHGNLASDGRPVLGLPARDLVELALESNPDCIVIPAHIWTPWYGILGSKSGFDSLEECFLDMAPHIHAVETGLSSDPAMNWMVPELAQRTIVSFSDAHSLPKLGREVTVFHGEMSYQGLARALASQGVAYTVEFYPEEGKYHFSGHRKCGVRLGAKETLGSNGRCPVCGRPMTLGVSHRVAILSDESTSEESTSEEGGPSQGNTNEVESRGDLVSSPLGRPPFMRLVPLLEIISQTMKVGVNSKRVQGEYRRVVQEMGSEFRVLIQASHNDLTRLGGEPLAQAVIRARTGKVRLEPGYDGVFGSVSVSPARVSPSGEEAGWNDGQGC